MLCIVRGRCRAFTLIELLVVIALIAILIALLFPAIRRVEENSQKTKCLSNLRQIAQAAMTYFGELGEGLPFLGEGVNDGSQFGKAAAQLMPYVKYQPEVFDCPANPGIIREPRLELTNAPGRYTEYEFNSHLCVFGPPGSKTRVRRQTGITDYSKAAYAFDYPYDPRPAPNYDPNRDRAHAGGINVAYLDGHAAWLQDEEMGPINPGNETTFYNKGHIFWNW